MSYRHCTKCRHILEDDIDQYECPRCGNCSYAPKVLRFPEAGDYGCVRVTAPVCTGREPQQDWDEAVRDGLIKPVSP